MTTRMNINCIEDVFDVYEMCIEEIIMWDHMELTTKAEIILSDPEMIEYLEFCNEIVRIVIQYNDDIRNNQKLNRRLIRP